MSAQESDKRDKRTTFSGVRTCLAFCEGCKHLSEQKKPVECREWNTEVKPEITAFVTRTPYMRPDQTIQVLEGIDFPSYAFALEEYIRRLESELSYREQLINRLLNKGASVRKGKAYCSVHKKCLLDEHGECGDCREAEATIGMERAEAEAARRADELYENEGRLADEIDPEGEGLA
jgi:hypothetical protein